MQFVAFEKIREGCVSKLAITAYKLHRNSKVRIHTLRQKFSIIVFQKMKQKCLVKLIPVIQNFDAIIPIRCRGIKGNSVDLWQFFSY